MKTSLLPLLIILLITGNLTAVLSDTDPGDALVMHDLSSSITGMNWPSKSDPCNWDLVTCTDGRVTAIQLGNKSVAGTLPASLGNLTALTRLELQYNDLSGPLPPLNKLTALQSLLLHNNKFTKVPGNFFSGLSGLQSVYLDNNPFDPWPIPRSLNECVSLVNFSAISTNVTGGVPDLFGALPSLTHLALSLNFLSGSIPNTFSGSSIRSLWLNSQKGPIMSGSIEVIGSMSGLEELWLQNNAFSGPLPDFTNLTDLYDLQLRDNQFTGIVPESLKSLKTLKRLTLSNNFLQGSVPEFKNPIKELDIDVKLESFCLNKVGDCDPRVNALLQIVKSWGYPLKFAMNWKGNDPCSGWVGITCGSDGNITVVNFRKMGLNGTVPEEFTLLPKVQTILLSGNNLMGVVPKSLSSITSLKELDLSDNNLSGEIPAFGKNVVVKTAGNPNIGKDIVTPDPNSHTLQNGTGLGSDDNGHKSKPVSTGVIVGSIIAVVFGISVIVLLGLFAYKKKRKHNSFGRVQSPNGNNMIVHPRRSGSDPDALKITINGGGSTSSYNTNMIEAGNMVIAIQVLRNVTNNFSEENILGRGGFGTVYKGELHDGTKIAVKRMESGVITSKGLNEFKSEIAVLTKVRHRNLVSLLGYCLDGNERLLVYEYMPQGTLSRHLFEWEKEGLSPLEWKQRLSIALDVARGVEYLHSLAHQSFIHRDLKPSNILLGDDMKAKVSDFGLVRLAPEGKGSIETRLAGTFGYLAPEYAVTGRVTTKADVYSFGVILMELITGRKALDETQPEESVHLVTWFRRMQLANKQEKTLKSIIDPTIKVEDEETLASISTVAELAGHCCAREPMQRPDMGHAVNVLASIAELWKPSDDRESEDVFGIDLDLTLPQALKKWQGMDGEAGSSSLGFDVENTYTSTGTRPPGFADSFTSVDGR